MKKKILAALLAAAMVLTLTACGGSDTAAPAEDAAEAVEEEAEAGAVEAAEETEEAADETAEESGAEAEAAAEESEEASEEETEEPAVEIKRGTIDGQTYENASIGVGITVPDGWTFYSDDEIAELNGIAKDMMDDDDLQAIFEQAGQYYDMMAVAEDQRSNINIILQPVDSGFLESKDYLKVALEQSEKQVAAALESAGLTDIQMTLDEGREFPVENFVSATVTGNYSGTPMTEKLVMCAVNGCLANITVSSTDSDLAESVISSFYALS